MRTGSLRFRLAAASTVLIILALVLTGIGLSITFRAALQERAAQELIENARLLSGYVTVDEGGHLRLERELPDTRAVRPYGGLYWQIDGDGQLLRSRSLWDRTLPPPVSSKPLGTTDIRRQQGPEGQNLIVAERTFTISSTNTQRRLRVTVALDTAQLEPVRQAFNAVLIPGLVIASFVLAAAMAVLFGIAVAPFRALRSAIAELLAGRSRTLTGSFPHEVQPVVSELNRLMRAESETLARARLQAGDLAHGLKTPLAVLAKVGRDAQERGEERMADEIRVQVALMDSHVTRALARTRAGLNAAQARQSVRIGPVVEKLTRMMRRLADPARLIDWHVEVAQNAWFPGDETDLFEILGAIFDNARKWASTRVVVRASTSQAGMTIVVEDDGPGLPEQSLAELGRGIRLDEARSGSGFGIAIAKDLVEAYDGTLDLAKSPAGGLSVLIRIQPPSPRRD